MHSLQHASTFFTAATTILLNQARQGAFQFSLHKQKITRADCSLCHFILLMGSSRIPGELHRKKKWFMSCTLCVLCQHSHKQQLCELLFCPSTEQICPNRQKPKPLWANHSELTSALDFPKDNFYPVSITTLYCPITD